MGKDFLRLVELAIASGVLLIPGHQTLASASASDEAPARQDARISAAANGAAAPVVRSARLDAAGLTIEFSEAIAPVAAVDPGKFRLTFAYYSKGRPGDYSYYYEYYAARRQLTVYSDVGRTALAERIEQPGANQIRIPASKELSLSSICDEIAAAKPEKDQAGLYLHYAEPGSLGIENARGVPLESIAPYWLANKDSVATRGAFRGRPIPVSVSCR